MRLIEDARYTIDQLIFDTYAEKYTYYYYSALLRAADRGVKIRIVYDGKTDVLDEELAPLLRKHDNIEVYYFNSINVFDPAGIMTFMHDKLTIVDGNKLLIGGANMGTTAYLRNFDMEVMITNGSENGAVGQAKRYFESIVNSGLIVRKTVKSCDMSVKTKYAARYEAFYGGLEIATADIDYSSQGVVVDKATFVCNPVNATKKAPVILTAVFNMMESSKKTVAVTPYTLLQNDKKTELKRLAAKNDSFTLITNSLYNSRNIAYSDYYYHRKDFLDRNITLMEYQADDQLHAKLFSFDDRYSIIGSFNLDERSAHVDTESVVVIDSPAFNAQLNDCINEILLSNSLQVGSDNKYIPSDTVKNRESDIPRSKRLKYFLYRIVGVVRCLI